MRDLVDAAHKAMRKKMEREVQSQVELDVESKILEALVGKMSRPWLCDRGSLQSETVFPEPCAASSGVELEMRQSLGKSFYLRKLLRERGMTARIS